MSLLSCRWCGVVCATERCIRLHKKFHLGRLKPTGELWVCRYSAAVGEVCCHTFESKTTFLNHLKVAHNEHKKSSHRTDLLPVDKYPVPSAKAVKNFKKKFVAKGFKLMVRSGEDSHYPPPEEEEEEVDSAEE